QQPERRRRPAARWTEERDQLSGCERQGQAIEGGDRAVAPAQVFQSDLDAGSRGGPHPGRRDRSRHLRPPPAAPGYGRPVSSRCTRARGRPANERITSRVKANNSEATATAIDTVALARPSSAMATCRFT